MGRETVSAFRSSYLRHLISRQLQDISLGFTGVAPNVPLSSICQGLIWFSLVYGLCHFSGTNCIVFNNSVGKV